MESQHHERGPIQVSANARHGVEFIRAHDTRFTVNDARFHVLPAAVYMQNYPHKTLMTWLKERSIPFDKMGRAGTCWTHLTEIEAEEFRSRFG